MSTINRSRAKAGLPPIPPLLTGDDEHDDVNYPKHYTSHPSGVECADITEHFMGNVSNAIKYLWRAGLKTDNPLKDLRKAQWCVAREIKRLTQQQG